MSALTQRTVYRACNLCEAICGLEMQIEGNRIISIRGDDADRFSRGHICPKAVALKDVHEDPNRLRTPMRRIGEGAEARWEPMDWDSAFDLAAERIAATLSEHGSDSVALYAGNPNVHNFGHLLNFPPLAKLIGSKNIYSASSVDQMPQQLVSYWMFGHQFLIPIPDIDHTDFFLVLGANPIASNGSMMTVPDVANRLKALRARGGKMVVIDPRRTETAEIADAHHFIRPGTDAAFLAAFINVLREEKLFRISAPEKLNGLDAALDALNGITAEAVAEHVGIAAADIRALARAFAAAPRAVAYGRMGTTTQTFGATNQWLIYLINIVTGNLDRVGGALPTQPLLPITGPGTRAGSFGRWRSRVRHLPEVNGELPVSALAEEISTPGEGQIRALLTIAGNPVLSTPAGRHLEQALRGLSFMVSIDIFINETTRFADLILPPASALSHDHYDSVFNAFAVRNVTRFNGAIWLRTDDERYDWEIAQGIGSRLAARLGREYRPAPRVHEVVGHACAQSGRIAPQALLAAVHGIDMGALQPSLMQRLQTPDGMIHCAPQLLVADAERIRNGLNSQPTTLQLIGRRHVRSNNSWMHQIHRLTKGKPRHQALMHPEDMHERGIADGARVLVRSAVDEVTLEVAASPDMMRGVVSIPHGFGHQRDGFSFTNAVEGVSVNDLTDPALIDPVSANAVLNGVPVSVSLAA